MLAFLYSRCVLSAFLINEYCVVFVFKFKLVKAKGSWELGNRQIGLEYPQEAYDSRPCSIL